MLQSKGHPYYDHREVATHANTFKSYPTTQIGAKRQVFPQRCKKKKIVDIGEWRALLILWYPSMAISIAEYISAAGDASGGHGGAIFTGGSGVTSISGLQYASHNSAASGGALYNEGTTLLMSTTNAFTTQFADNDAQVRKGVFHGHDLVVSACTEIQH